MRTHTHTQRPLEGRNRLIGQDATEKNGSLPEELLVDVLDAAAEVAVALGDGRALVLARG